jgi:hypothetical protein
MIDEETRSGIFGESSDHASEKGGPRDLKERRKSDAGIKPAC